MFPFWWAMGVPSFWRAAGWYLFGRRRDCNRFGWWWHRYLFGGCGLTPLFILQYVAGVWSFYQNIWWVADVFNTSLVCCGCILPFIFWLAAGVLPFLLCKNLLCNKFNGPGDLVSDKIIIINDPTKGIKRPYYISGWREYLLTHPPTKVTRVSILSIWAMYA